jgi:hypothetical protein
MDESYLKGFGWGLITILQTIWTAMYKNIMYILPSMLNKLSNQNVGLQLGYLKSTKNPHLN